MSNQVEVVLFAYGSPLTGTGHLRRSHLLSSQLSAENVTCSFYAVGPSDFSRDVLGSVALVHHETIDTWLELLRNVSANLVVIDIPWSSSDVHGFVPELSEAISLLSRKGTSVISVGKPNIDIPEVRAFVDLYPDGNPSNMNGVILPTLTPISPLILDARRSNEAQSARRRGHVFLSMGGSDPFRLLGAAARVIARVQTVTQVSILATRAQKSEVSGAVSDLEAAGKTVECFIDVDSRIVGEAMASAEVGVVAFGTTAFEAMTLGLPTLAVCHYAYQRPAAQWFSALEMLKEFGSADVEVNWDQLEDSLRRAVLKDSLHAERKSNELFDGQGAQRLTNLIVQHLAEAREPALDHLFIFSHPGNEVQLAGGTISRLSARGERVGVVLVGDGLSSRQSSSRFARERATQQLALECAVHESQDALGVHSSYWLRNPDNDLSRVSLAKLGAALAVILERHKPGVIWTHAMGELNSDYDIVVRAVQIAAREGAHTRLGVLGCPSAMSSSWAFAPMALRPQVRVPLDVGDISRAQGAYAAYHRTGYWRQRPESWESWETARRFAAISSPDDWAEAFFAYEIRLPALSSSLGSVA